METERILVVALEDLRTAPAVARKAGLIAIAERTRLVVLLHIVADMIGTGLGFEPAGCWMPDGTPTDEVADILAAAENTLDAVYAAHHQSPPLIRRVIGTGPIPEAIMRAATSNHAVGVVLGARRPHRLGLLFHPDVAARVAPRLGCPIHVAPLLHSAEASTVQGREKKSIQAQTIQVTHAGTVGATSAPKICRRIAHLSTRDLP